MRAVNLLPRDEPARSFEAKRGVVFLGAGGAAVVTAVLVTLMLGAGGSVKQERQALDLINAELLALPKAEGQGSEPDDSALAAEKAARIGALSTALGGRIAWDGVLRQISQVLPEDVWLSGLATTGAAAPGGSAKLTLNGSTYSQDGVARFLSRISVLPALANVQLQTSAADPGATSRIVQFVIVADVKAPGTGATS
jgi:Tfp pilus assembly protein PilN